MSGPLAWRAACFRTAPRERAPARAVATADAGATRGRLPPLAGYAGRPPWGGSRGRAARAGTGGPGSSPASVSRVSGRILFRRGARDDGLTLSASRASSLTSTAGGSTTSSTTAFRSASSAVS
jgi:hypothetical protein